MLYLVDYKWTFFYGLSQRIYLFVCIRLKSQNTFDKSQTSEDSSFIHIIIVCREPIQQIVELHFFMGTSFTFLLCFSVPGDYIMWETGRTRCQYNHCPCFNLEIYTSAFSTFPMDQWCRRQIGIFRGSFFLQLIYFFLKSVFFKCNIYVLRGMQVCY